MNGPILRGARRGQSGAVLLEVLVGLAIFAVGVVAVLGSLRSSISLVGRSENLLRASLVLDEVARRWSRSPDSAEERRGIVEPGGFAWSVEFGIWQDGDVLPLPLAAPARPGESSGAGAPGAVFDLRDEFELLHVTVSWEERGRSHGIETWELIPLPEMVTEDTGSGEAEPGEIEPDDGEPGESG